MVSRTPSMLLLWSVALGPPVSHIVLAKSASTTLAVLVLTLSNTVPAVSAAQLIASWVLGVLGPHATGNVDGELKDKPALLLLKPLLEAVLALAPKIFALATQDLVARIVSLPLGTIGNHALSLAVVVPNIVVVMSTCQLNFALS
jgi:hypothetical protein